MLYEYVTGLSCTIFASFWHRCQQMSDHVASCAFHLNKGRKPLAFLANKQECHATLTQSLPVSCNIWQEQQLEHRSPQPTARQFRPSICRNTFTSAKQAWQQCELSARFLCGRAYCQTGEAYELALLLLQSALFRHGESGASAIAFNADCTKSIGVQSRSKRSLM